MPTDAEIAASATLQPIAAVASRAGIPEAALEPYGRLVAKVDLARVPAVREAPRGKLVLVAAINPTPAGEGKTTTTIGLADALTRLGRRAMVCLREPSLGPVFGAKGGATGGGRAQIAPKERIDLHFTGDIHAVSAAHNLLAALLDNHLHWGNALGIDPRRITFRRALDMNDRSLRGIVTGLGGLGNGAPREDGFDIAVASEVMAILCLAQGLADLRARLARIVVGRTRDGRAVTAADLHADGPMAALLRDALSPNLVQTLEGTPAFVHGGPFANIAHGCNSVIATRAALGLAEIVVTEAGFGADLGAEKFLNIKCRQAGLAPSCAVVVATVRALKMNGGAAKGDLAREDLGALARGLPNLARHVENLAKFGLPVLVAVNRFATDTEAELAMVVERCREAGTEAHLCAHHAMGGAGALGLAEAVAGLCADEPSPPRLLYPDAMPLANKLRTVAREIYRAAEVAFEPRAARRLAELEAEGHGSLPVCVAKTQYSFSADPTFLGAPTGHTLPVREVRLSAGAGFVVAICGEVNIMPGLPRVPAAERIGVDEAGRITGL